MNYRGTATDAPKSSKCLDCLPLWDRKGNVKAVQLCQLHKATPDLLEWIKDAENEFSQGVEKGGAGFNRDFIVERLLPGIRATIARAEGR